jgi:hypothetical protein
MIDASSSECEQFLREAVNNKTWPMACDLVSVPHVVAALRPFMRVSLGMVNEAWTTSAPRVAPRYPSVVWVVPAAPPGRPRL